MHQRTGLEEGVDHGAPYPRRTSRDHDALLPVLLLDRHPAHGDETYFPGPFPGSTGQDQATGRPLQQMWAAQARWPSASETAPAVAAIRPAMTSSIDSMGNR